MKFWVVIVADGFFDIKSIFLDRVITNNDDKRLVPQELNADRQNDYTSLWMPGSFVGFHKLKALVITNIAILLLENAINGLQLI